jgi:hypothetical protein
MVEMRNTYRVLVGKSEGSRQLGRSKRRWEDVTGVNIEEMGWDGVAWIHVAEERQCWAFVNRVMNMWVS